MRYQLTRDEVVMGLGKLREMERQVDLVRVAENDLRRYVAQLGILYNVPEGWQIRDWMVGFEQPEVSDGNDNGQRTDSTN